MSFLKQTKYRLLIAISTTLALNSFFFIERKSTNAFPLIFDNIKLHYLLYITCIGGLFWVWYKFLKDKKTSQLIKIVLLTTLPMELVFVLGLFITHSETKVHSIFYFLTGFYLVLSALFFIENKQNFQKSKRLSKQKITTWLKKQGLITFFILFVAFSTFAYFSTDKIANYAGVDEPLWTFDRIPYFWKNVAEMDWKNTSISDKPGITVVMISGLGLLHNDPMSYAKLENFDSQKDIRIMNQAFRLPLAIFCLLSLILFYIFIQELLGRKIALLSTILISTSPMLIGMSRIINPDAILWVFVPLTILAYLIFVKKQTRFWLYLAGILLGLSILTKYVANILYIFFFALIFIEYLFANKKESVSDYLKKSFTNFTSLILISLITFFILFPETWVNLSKLFTGTILSQAFVSIAPIFIFILLFLFIDTLILKNKLIGPILNFFIKYKSFLILIIIGFFTLLTLFNFFNTFFSMSWIDFETILSSPKTSYRTNSIFSIFVTNFYPLVFASLPIVLLGLFFAILYFFKKYPRENPKIKVIFYFIFFILLYYLGTTANGVVSTIRYQVTLYPLLLIISAIGINYLIQLMPTKKYLFPLACILLLFIGIFTLARIKPFYLGYASKLLPNKYIVDVKDMGDGSYEIAQYLNMLPDAKNLFVWTDKKGVCTFFVGKCDSFYDALSFKNSPKIDYFVISASRKNKIIGETKGKNSLPYSFEEIYNSPESEHSIFIGNREKNYIKILKAEDFKK